MRLDDTIIAAASPFGRSARALVRLSGPATPRLARDTLGLDWSRGVRTGAARLGVATLSVLALCQPAPRSYTAQDTLEVLLPGSPLLLERVVALLIAAGEGEVRAAGPGEFTARAFLAGRLTLEQAEGVAAMIAAESRDALSGARDLLSGRAGKRVAAWRDEVATLLALVEAGIDFTDQEDVVAIAAPELARRCGVVAGEIERALASRGGGPPAAGDPLVVLAGEPSAGKSTLFNALLGRRRSVVAAARGTTRDVIEEALDLSRDVPGGGRVRLADLAGLDADPDATESRRETHAAAQRAALDAIARADLVLLCDPAGRFAPLRTDATTLRVLTKADRAPPPDAAPGDAPPAADIAVCALDGWNVGVLRRMIARAVSASRGAAAGSLLPRHRAALAASADRLRALARGAGGEAEIRAADLRAALDDLGEVAGRVRPDEVLARIFATFCVGK